MRSIRTYRASGKRTDVFLLIYMHICDFLFPFLPLLSFFISFSFPFSFSFLLFPDRQAAAAAAGPESSFLIYKEIFFCLLRAEAGRQDLLIFSVVSTFRKNWAVLKIFSDILDMDTQRKSTKPDESKEKREVTACAVIHIRYEKKSSVLGRGDSLRAGTRQTP